MARTGTVVAINSGRVRSARRPPARRPRPSLGLGLLRGGLLFVGRGFLRPSRRPPPSSAGGSRRGRRRRWPRRCREPRQVQSDLGQRQVDENKSFFDRRSLPSYQVVNSPIVSLPSASCRRAGELVLNGRRRGRSPRGAERAPAQRQPAAPGEFRRCRRWCPRLGHAERCGRSQEEQQGGCYPRHGPHGCKRVSTVQMQLPTGCSYENCTA